jgi:histidyl-tRNA synthetase
MSNKVQAIRGTQSMLGEEAERFHAVVSAFDRVRRLYGFQRVEVPVFEATSVFARSLGETTDVVSKEMYTFEDRGGDSLTLRPEFTAGIARAYISEGWQRFGVLKLATEGPIFRYERPQKGRYRQFHQLDAEILGAGEYWADVEVIALASRLLNGLGLEGKVELQLNTLGDAETRSAWREALIAHFEAHRGDLSEDSVRRLGANPLRILDSKDAKDRPIADAAPDIDSFLTADAGSFFGKVTKGLDAAGVGWTRNARLVRGLDYYRHTAFEFVTDQLGAQGTVLAGGRYDGLVDALGGPPTPGVGWAAGIERLAMLMVDMPPAMLTPVVIIPVGEAAEVEALRAAAAVRRRGFGAEVLMRGNLKKRLARANDLNASTAIIIGDDELAAGEATVKHLRVQEQQRVPLGRLVETLWPTDDFAS